VTCADLDRAAQDVREWLRLKTTTGACSAGFICQLAEHLCRIPQSFGGRPLLVDVHAVFDEIGALDAFPGGRVGVAGNEAYIEIEMHQHGLLRPLSASELSDGTLRYLLLVAALLSPRPPALMILNEPETSLHPDLLPSLPRLIVRASKQSQLIVVSHAPVLVDALDAAAESRRIVLEKNLGETIVPDLTPPDWTWPSR